MNGGPEPARQLCRAIALRVADDPDLVAVELRWERYPVIGYFRGETGPQAVRRVAQCPVAPSEGAP